MRFQRTITKPVETIGVGLHSGQRVRLGLKPAPENHGVTLVRTDLSPHVHIDVAASKVQETMLCTGIVDADGVSVFTIEHLFSALAGLGIDNIIIEVDKAEVPVMDGSASPFIYLLESAGIQEQRALKKYIQIQNIVRVEDGDKWIEFRPHAGFKVDYEIDFAHPKIASSNQRLQIDFSTQTFIDDICRARTFGFMKDVDYLRQNNLAKGASLDNAVVLNDYNVLNPDGLRFDDEFVRHKVLDALGDIYVLGHAVLGELRAYKSGHALNNKLIRSLLAQPEAFRYVEFPETTQEESLIGNLVFA